MSSAQAYLLQESSCLLLSESRVENAMIFRWSCSVDLNAG
jgi:hypothetical protein